MKEIRLSGKKILLDKCRLIKKCKTNESWQDDFMVMAGEWKTENGCLIGKEGGNKGGILFYKEYFDKNTNVLLKFKAKTVLPATRDVNAVFCAKWDTNIDYLGESYVCGLNGWWEGKCGIESNDERFRALTNSYKYEPGKEIEMICGSIQGHTFMVVDGELIMEFIDTQPILGGHVGFSPYCTILQIRDVEIFEISWEEFIQSYTPEF